MEAKLALKDWSIKREEGAPPTITGEYEVIVGGKSFATQGFNCYNGKKLSFTDDLMKHVQELEKGIAKEIEELLT